MFDIITIGTATSDIFLTSKLFKIINDPKHLKKIGIPTGEAECFALGAKIEIERPVFTTGGGAANAAVTFAKQGLKTATLVKIGRDEAAEKILNELKKQKISAFPIYDKKSGTDFSVVLLAPSGERTILVHHGASKDLKISEIPFNKIKSRWAYISPGNISFKTLSAIYSRLEKQNTLIAINPSKRLIETGVNALKPILSKSRVVILNREEAACLTKTDYSKDGEIFKKLDRAVKGIAVMTDGERGIMVSDGKKIYASGIFKPKKVADVTGAGDAFASGFVSGLIHQIGNWKLEIGNLPPEAVKYAIRLGSANASSAISKIGAKEGILSKKDFESDPRWKNLEIIAGNL